MYSRSKAQSQYRSAGSEERSRGSTSAAFTPPPGYDGSRFRRRSDGRDDTFPLHEHEAPVPEKQRAAEKAEVICEQRDEKCEALTETAHGTAKKSISIPFLQSIGKEELLIIALIIVLAGERERCGSDTILLLALLLCIG